MKTLLTLLSICTLSMSGRAQIFSQLKDKLNQKVNNAIDKASGKKQKSNTDSTARTKIADSTTTSANPAAVTGAASGATDGNAGSIPEDIKAYSKFDFVPGEKIIVEENFEQDAIGEFPDKWNTKTNAEVVTLNNRPGKWLCMKQDGVFFPEYIPELPDNFTLQVDILTNNNVSNISTLTIALASSNDVAQKFDIGYANSGMNTPGIKLNLNPLSSGEGTFEYATHAIGGASMQNPNEFHVPNKPFATLSVWRQKQRVRVYLNSTKMLDLPRALEAGAVINALIFGAYAPNYDNKGGALYLSNIRLAVGAPDTRNKLITEGKFVTHGILFDVNSDQIKAQSYGAMQDIAGTLKSNPTVKVKIVGHTDSDGDDKVNLDLSKRRADAVKAMLVSTFGIEASRLQTDGKGKTQPIDNNTTTVGKANNRRVEFIKL
jgi:outer membrane protein OmpA-like peptidoglycan-associated protein